jgi:DNA-binding transcriptional MerR regulator
VLTIDQLAHEAGMTVRNVRAHNSRGLLPPPEVRGRTGYYGPQHVERLQLIRRLQGEGLKLDGIKRLLADSDERLLALRRAAEEPAETPQLVRVTELIERLELTGEDVDARVRLVRKAEDLGILALRGDREVEIKSPALLAAAEEAVRSGVSLAHALDMIESVTRHSRAASREFVKLFMDDVWSPFAEAGMPDERWDELAQSIQHVRPLAAQALLAVFRRTMDAEIEKTFAELARRLARERN